MSAPSFRVLVGDALARLRELPAASVQAIVTSPPYWALRDYGVAGQLGLEDTPDAYVAAVVEVFREVRRVLRPDGLAFVNLGDTYANDAKWGGSTGGKHVRELHGNTGVGRRKRKSGLPPKCLVGIPWRVALAMLADGWTLRCDNVWHKPNLQPEAAEDRPTRDHEYVFTFSLGERYFADMHAVRQPVTGGAHARGVGSHPKSAAAAAGTRQNSSFSAAVTGLVSSRNLRSVWTIHTEPNAEEHFATFPEALPELCIRMATSEIGCCRSCGAPISRVLRKVRCLDGKPVPPELPPQRGEDRDAPSGAQGVGHWRITTERETAWWRLGCRCFAGPPVPCTVLDPFGGLMTTGLAALSLGRSFVGVELNPDYAAAGERRLQLRFLEVAALPPQQLRDAAAAAPPGPVQLALLGAG